MAGQFLKCGSGCLSEHLADLSIWGCMTSLVHWASVFPVWLSSPNEKIIKYSAPVRLSNKLIGSFLPLARFVVRLEELSQNLVSQSS